MIAEARTLTPRPVTGRGAARWRLGMAHVAPFVHRLPAPVHRAVIDRALHALGAPPVLHRRMVRLHAMA